MHIMAIALGGCIRGEPRYGITEDTGGHVTYVLGAMRALSKRGDVSQAEIVTRLFDNPELGAVHAEQTERLTPSLSITRIETGTREYLSKDRLAADLPAFTQALIAQLQERERLPDVIHAHFADAAEVARLVREALGIPFIYTAHSLGIDKRMANGSGCPKLDNRIAQENRAIGSADAIIGSSRDECERQLMAYRSSDETRIHRIRPGIDQTPALPRDVRQARKLIAPFLRDANKPIILAIARPVRKKNLAALVEAYAHSDQLKQGANLVLLPGLRHSIGRGEAEQVEVMAELVDLIDRHDLHGKVAYPRQHDPSHVRGLYALARDTGGVFVNSALFEPFGLTILEAAVHGLPVVATCHGGPGDIIGEIQHGSIVEPTDRAAIAEAIGALLEDPTAWQAASANAAANIARVTWSDYARAIRKVARSLMRPTVARLARSKKPYLLICDIDNTLTGCRKSASRLTRFLSARGDIAFGVATGRSLIEARRLMRDWDLPEPSVWITSVGTQIHWTRGQSLEADEDFTAKIDKNWRASAVKQALESIDAAQLQELVNQRRHKLSYFLEDRAALRSVRKAVGVSSSCAKVVFSHERLLDILPARAGKSAAVSHVANTLGLAMDQVMVAGDSGNDIDMLQDCPNAILVANCEAELRVLGESGSAYFAQGEHAAGVLEGVLVHLRNMNAVPMEQAA